MTSSTPSASAASVSQDQSPVSAVHDEPRDAGQGLSQRDRETVEFAALRWKYSGARASAILDRFGESETRFYQRLLVLLASPEVEAEYPAEVRRLRRTLAARHAARTRAASA